MDQPLVSVVMTVFNGLPYVREAIDSVLAQDDVDLELVVVDDGSTDGTADVVAGYEDPRLRLVRRPHEGRVAAMNTAVATARGTYLANLDADDVALPGRFARSATYLEEHPDVAAVGSAVQPYLGSTRPARRLPTSSRAIRWAFLLRNPMFHSSVTYRARVVRELGGFDPAYAEMSDDADMLLRIATHHPLVNLPVALSSRRLHAQQHFASKPGVVRARLHARCRRRAARELRFPLVLRPIAVGISWIALTRSWLVLGALDRNGRMNHHRFDGVRS